MKYKQFIYSLLLALTLSACSEDGDIDDVIVSKESVRAAFDKRLAVSYSNTTVIEYEGGRLTIYVSSNLEWTVSVPTWCSCNVSSGKDNGVFNVTVTENTNLSSRSGVITVTATGVDAQSIKITQKGNPYSDLPNSGDNIPPA